MSRKMNPEEKRLPRSISFDRSVLARIDKRAKNQMISRSTFVNIELDKILTMEEKNMGLSS